MKQVSRKPLFRTTFLDRVIAAVSPTLAGKRVHARAMFEHMASFQVRRTGAGSKGTLYNKAVNRQNRITEGMDREALALRAQDLAANDPHAASIVDAMPLNIVGPGLVPQSRPNAARLKITEEQERSFQEQAEWAFKTWSRRADAGGRWTFGAIQFSSVWALVVDGEYLLLPVMRKRPAARYSFAVQMLDPLRLRTPVDRLSDKSVRDGVVLGTAGEPVAYWIADPDDGMSFAVASAQFRRVPAWRGHRPQVLHSFVCRDPERVRGESLLGPGIKTFYDLADYQDYELVGAILAASFAVFMEMPESINPLQAASDMGTSTATGGAGQSLNIQEVEPGQIYYGRAGQKPHILKSERPAASYQQFVEHVLRAAGASLGLPYEVVAKDFSKTNYSSARAALLEAWRLYHVHQTWLVDGLCRPVWDMVIEEAVLRGDIIMPEGAPGFYEEREAWCECVWLPPKRGHIDPVKETSAAVEALNNNMTTLAAVAAENGEDYESLLKQRAREQRLAEELGVRTGQAQPAQQSKDEDTDKEDDDG